MVSSLKVLKESMLMKILTLGSTNVQAISELIFKKNQPKVYELCFLNIVLKNQR